MAQRELESRSLLDLLAILLQLLGGEDVDLGILGLSGVIEGLELLQPIICDCDHPLCGCDLGLRVAEIHDLLEVLVTPLFVLLEDDRPNEVTITEGKPLILDLVWEIFHQLNVILDERNDVDSREFWVLAYGWRALFELVLEKILLLPTENLLHELQCAVLGCRENDIDSEGEICMKILP